jgi:hypothetical protein
MIMMLRPVNDGVWSGRLLDRVSPRPVMTAGSVLAVPAVLGIAVTPSLPDDGSLVAPLQEASRAPDDRSVQPTEACNRREAVAVAPNEGSRDGAWSPSALVAPERRDDRSENLLPTVARDFGRLPPVDLQERLLLVVGQVRVQQRR